MKTICEIYIKTGNDVYAHFNDYDKAFKSKSWKDSKEPGWNKNEWKRYQTNKESILESFIGTDDGLSFDSETQIKKASRTDAFYLLLWLINISMVKS